MTNSKRSSVVFMAAVSVVSVFGAAACQPGGGSGSSPNQAFFDGENDTRSDAFSGATCEGYETKAL